MAVTIKLKNASGSDPSASDLVVGEVALRTDTAKLFTKKDDNSVAEIGGSTTVADDAISTAKIQDDAVTQAKIAAGAVGRTEIATAAISSDEIDTGQVTTAKIGDLAVSTAKLGNDAVTSAKIADDSINSEHYVDGSIDHAHLSNDCVDGDNIADDSINSEHYVNGSIDTAHIADDQVTYAKIQNVSATNRILGRDSSGAGVIEEITPANLRTMLNVADGATNVTNTNQLTNGAGFITATLTNEQVQDIVGGMVSGNTESGISVTYQDSDGTLDFSVTSQTDNNFTTTLKNKLDGIASGATNVTNNNQLTNGAGYITSADGGNAATLDSIDSSQFLRSDTADSASGILSLSGGLSFGSDSRCAAGISALSDGSTITVDFTSGIHHSVTLGGNRTFGNPSNDGNAVGQCGSIFITQDGTGGRTASFHSDYKFVGGTAPTLSTAANAIDRLDYIIKASGVIHCVVSLDVK